MGITVYTSLQPVPEKLRTSAFVMQCGIQHKFHTWSTTYELGEPSCRFLALLGLRELESTLLFTVDAEFRHAYTAQ